MNTFAWTAVVALVLLSLSGLLFALAAFLEWLACARGMRALLVRAAAEFLLCLFVGLLIALGYYAGLGWEAGLPIPNLISFR